MSRTERAILFGEQLRRSHALRRKQADNAFSVSPASFWVKQKCRLSVAGNLLNSLECRPETFLSPSPRTPKVFERTLPMRDLPGKDTAVFKEICEGLQEDRAFSWSFRDDRAAFASTLNP